MAIFGVILRFIYIVGAGLETPDMIELRKRRIEADMEGGETPSLPYTVIPERQNARIGASMMGSTHTYDIKVINTFSLF